MGMSIFSKSLASDRPFQIVKPGQEDKNDDGLFSSVTTFINKKAAMGNGFYDAMQSTVPEAVNFNDPKQTVIAGTKAAVDAACVTLKGMGAKRALPLPVSAPFHCSLMKPAAEVLKARLATTAFVEPSIPVINNIDAAVLEDPDAIKEALYRQAYGPVRWVDCMRAVQARGATHLIESGP